MNAKHIDPRLTTVPDETHAQRLARHATYLHTLGVLLLDLQPVPSGRELRIGPLTIWLDTEPYCHQVLISSGHWGKRGNRRRYRRTEATYIARQVRRLLAEQTEQRAAQKAYTDRVTAQCEREEAAKAPFQALADRLNQRSVDAHAGNVMQRPVREVTCDEVSLNGTRGYHFALRLEHLTEQQVFDILTIAERGVFLAEVAARTSDVAGETGGAR